jgi:hypothetical protein
LSQEDAHKALNGNKITAKQGALDETLKYNLDAKEAPAKAIEARAKKALLKLVEATNLTAEKRERIN